MYRYPSILELDERIGDELRHLLDRVDSLGQKVSRTPFTPIEDLVRDIRPHEKQTVLEQARHDAQERLRSLDEKRADVKPGLPTVMLTREIAQTKARVAEIDQALATLGPRDTLSVEEPMAVEPSKVATGARSRGAKTATS